MKQLFFIFLFIASISCVNQKDENIKKFETRIGPQKIELLDKLILEFEEQLKLKFRTNDLEQAYYRYFLENIHGDNQQKIFNDDRISEIKESLIKIGLEKEIILKPFKTKQEDLILFYTYLYEKDDGEIDTINIEHEFLKFPGINMDSLIQQEKDEIKFNENGDYINAIEEIESSDSILTDYLSIKNLCGFIQDNIFSNAMLYYTVDIDDYFIKRIILIEYLY